MNATTENFALKLRSFASKILYFNGLYKLPVAPYPAIDFLKESYQSRLKAFENILREEVDEIKDVPGPTELDLLVNMADLLGDIVVYCHSEAAKYGIPLDEVLMIIMDSNFSKLGTNGEPIYDERGKVMKGPFYWKPEPKIRELLEERIKEGTGS